MTQSVSKYENCLNIHLIAFTLPKNILNDDEEVRISITSLPEENKQCFCIQGKKINNTNHVFSLKVTEKTKKIIMVFRKKYLSENPIIASATIHLNEFKDIPQDQMFSGMVNSDIKILNIYYPLQKQMEENKETEGKKVQRRILGKMRIQLSVSAPFSSVKLDKTKKTNNKSEHKILGNKIQQNRRRAMKADYSRINNDFCCENYSLF